MKLEAVAQGRVIPNSGLRSFTEARVAAHTNTRARRQFRHGSPGRGRSRLVALGEREGGVWPQIGDATIPPGGGNLCNFRPFVAKACTTLVVTFAPLGLHSHSVSVCARARGLVVTVKPYQRRISDSPHRSGDCPTAAWCGASLTVLKHLHCGHSHASVVKYP